MVYLPDNNLLGLLPEWHLHKGVFVTNLFVGSLEAGGFEGCTGALVADESAMISQQNTNGHRQNTI